MTSSYDRFIPIPDLTDSGDNNIEKFIEPDYNDINNIYIERNIEMNFIR
jgi:hypothetical protein